MLDDPQSFEDWLAAVYNPEEIPDDRLNAPTLRWLRGLFDLEGPVPAKRARDAYLAHQLALANEAATAMLSGGVASENTPLRASATSGRSPAASGVYAHGPPVTVSSTRRSLMACSVESGSI